MARFGTVQRPQSVRPASGVIQDNVRLPTPAAFDVKDLSGGDADRARKALAQKGGDDLLALFAYEPVVLNSIAQLVELDSQLGRREFEDAREPAVISLLFHRLTVADAGDTRDETKVPRRPECGVTGTTAAECHTPTMSRTVLSVAPD